MFDPNYISENERWIDGWRGYYSVSKDGTVKNYKHDVVTEVAHHISPDSNGQDYVTVTLGLYYEHENFSVSRLVYETFVRPLSDKERIVCKNGNRRDLRLENLEVKTVTEVNNNPDRIAKDRAAKYAIIVLQWENSDKVIDIVGFTNAKERCGIDGITLRTKIRKAERAGESFITYKKKRIEFLIQRPARYDNCDPYNARKNAA